jgi:hypothetical protein
MASLRHAFLLAWSAGMGVGCTLDRSGLSTGDHVVTEPPRDASVGTGQGGAAGDGAGGSSGEGGAAGDGAGGSVGAGGAAGDGGATGAGGSAGAAGAGGSGGATADAGGGDGGAGGLGGAGGGAGAGGQGGGADAGAGGAAGSPCMRFPNAMQFNPPMDNRTHCYWSHTDAQNWTDAQSTCMADGGHLVTILSPAENTFVIDMAPFAGQFNDIWIGATDGRPSNNTMGPGTYRWVTPEPFNYHPWAPGQPDGFCDPCQMGSQTCTCDHRGSLASDGTWADWFADNPRTFVCESP